MFPGPSELILILIILVVVFGPKKIPEIMKGLGQGIRTFKKSMEGDDAPTPPSPSEHSPQGTLPVMSKGSEVTPGRKTGPQ
jgi:sec-independent protein translocase protein TatA